LPLVLETSAHFPQIRQQCFQYAHPTVESRREPGRNNKPPHIAQSPAETPYMWQFGLTPTRCRPEPGATTPASRKCDSSALRTAVGMQGNRVNELRGEKAREEFVVPGGDLSAEP
jgi:hypothetical protein